MFSLLEPPKWARKWIHPGAGSGAKIVFGYDCGMVTGHFLRPSVKNFEIILLLNEAIKFDSYQRGGRKKTLPSWGKRKRYCSVK